LLADFLEETSQLRAFPSVRITTAFLAFINAARPCLALARRRFIVFARVGCAAAFFRCHGLHAFRAFFLFVFLADAASFFARPLFAAAVVRDCWFRCAVFANDRLFGIELELVAVEVETVPNHTTGYIGALVMADQGRCQVLLPTAYLFCVYLRFAHRRCHAIIAVVICPPFAIDTAWVTLDVGFETVLVVFDRRRADHHMGDNDELGDRYPKSRIRIHDESKLF